MVWIFSHERQTGLHHEIMSWNVAFFEKWTGFKVVDRTRPVHWGPFWALNRSVLAFRPVHCSSDRSIAKGDSKGFNRSFDGIDRSIYRTNSELLRPVWVPQKWTGFKVVDRTRPVHWGPFWALNRSVLAFRPVHCSSDRSIAKGATFQKIWTHTDRSVSHTSRPVYITKPHTDW